MSDCSENDYQNEEVTTKRNVELDVRHLHSKVMNLTAMIYSINQSIVEFMNKPTNNINSGIVIAEIQKAMEKFLAKQTSFNPNYVPRNAESRGNYRGNSRGNYNGESRGNYNGESRAPVNSRGRYNDPVSNFREQRKNFETRTNEVQEVTTTASTRPATPSTNSPTRPKGKGKGKGKFVPVNDSELTIEQALELLGNE